MDTYRLVLWVAVSSTVATGCGSDSDQPAGGGCIPGKSVSCACPNGSTGAQICKDDGTFGACVCNGTDGGPGEDASPNPCQTDNGGCSPDADCSWSGGGVTCTCKQGYSGNGKSCSDVDECATSPRPCDTNAICTNTVGAFECECNPGYAGDGVACVVLDTDSDTISDLDEGLTQDADGDGIPNFQDPDSDDDGIPDAAEAGDDDVATPPVDSDDDGLPDFLDTDSDDDGLGDEAESEHGTDPTVGDTDDDGAGDMVEVAIGTDPLDGESNPGSALVFVLPHGELTHPALATAAFRTSIPALDLYLLVDQSGSMDQEFLTLQSGLVDMVAGLVCPTVGGACSEDADCPIGAICHAEECVQDPLSGAGCIPEIWTGVGVFNNCHTYDNQMHLQPDAAITAASLDPEGYPGSTEAVLQAAGCVADPTHCSNDTHCGSHPGLAGTVGCPGFRPDARRALVQLTDAGNQGNCVFSVTTAGGLLTAHGIKYVGVYGSDDPGGAPCSTAQACTSSLAAASGSMDINGNPFAYAATNGAVLDATRTGAADLVTKLPMTVKIEAFGEPGDDGIGLALLDHVEVNVSGSGACTATDDTADTSGDGTDDTFSSLLPGTPICWDVHPVTANDSVPALAEPQAFKVRLVVRGDNVVLDTRSVYFVIPPDA